MLKLQSVQQDIKMVDTNNVKIKHPRIMKGSTIVTMKS